MAEIVIRNLRKEFGAFTAVQGSSFTIKDGEFFMLLGPSGCGKTTTLRMIAGLELPTSGEILIDGKDVSQRPASQRDIAMVFQMFALYPHMSVRKNIAYPLVSQGVPKAQVQQKVAEVAEVLRIPHKLDNKATALSGGEMQRVSIGRALVRNPRIYLMDEPLSSLDAKLRADLRIELKRIHADMAATFLYVTHDQIEAMTMATHVGVLDRGQLVQFGTPRDIYENPVSTYVAARLGQPHINLLPATAFPGAPSNATQIGLRPEHIHVGDGQDATIQRVEHLGDQTRLHLTLGPCSLITLTQPHTALKPGETLKIRPHNPLWFDASGNRI